jgi:autotransporter-associated beta strand protein
LQWAPSNNNDVSPITIGSGGATLDTNSNDVNLADPVSGTGSLTKVGLGTLALQATSNGYLGDTSIRGGLVGFSSANGLGTGQVTLDGGGLQWLPGNTADISSRLNAIGAGGATFDTHGNNVTLAQPLSGLGPVAKTGAGTLTLSAANTYSGSTDVQQGTLTLTGSLVGHATLASGATLNCNGGALNGGFTNNGGTAAGGPAAPTGVSATPGNGHATVSFTPGDPHCFPVGYTAASSPGGVHGSGFGSPVTVTPLTDGTTYTFTVTATNPIGSSPASGSSSAVKPLGPPPIARILSPASGSRFNYEAFVPTTIRCMDGGGGPGISFCTDSVHGTDVLDTSHPGTFKYMVIAVSEDGQAAIAQITYSVLFPNNKFNSPRVHPNRDGSVSFSLQLPFPGTVDVLESAAKSNRATAASLKPGKGQFAFASVHTRIKKAGTAKFRIKPNAAGRALMKHHRHPVVIRLSITYTPAQGKPRTDTIKALRLTR